MKAFLYYISYPFLLAIALLPFPLLYLLSDLLYYTLRLSGYRKSVVLKNLRNSFPEKSERDVQQLANAFFSYLCDLILETLKTLNMSAEDTNRRCVFHNTPWLDELYSKKQSFVIVMGHYGNWEWAGPSFTLSTGFQLVVIYRPLENPYFERMTTRMRTRFGTRIVPENQTLRAMVANKNQLTATAFIADQNAHREKTHWLTFLNQDTSVFTGPEKLSVKFGYPVVYMSVRRKKRGYYEIFPELLVPNPVSMPEGEISKAFMKRLEKDIQEDPSVWLWSHKRWKHTRPETDTQ